MGAQRTAEPPRPRWRHMAGQNGRGPAKGAQRAEEAPLLRGRDQDGDREEMETTERCRRRNDGQAAHSVRGSGNSGKSSWSAEERWRNNPYTQDRPVQQRQRQREDGPPARQQQWPARHQSMRWTPVPPMGSHCLPQALLLLLRPVPRPCSPLKPRPPCRTLFGGEEQPLLPLHP